MNMIDQPTGNLFPTIFGRNLIRELPNFVHRPYLVVSMADLWPHFAPSFTDPAHALDHQLDRGLAAVHLVDTLEHHALRQQVAQLPPVQAVIGLGGGQALDVAKYVAWQRRIPLFQVPTAMTVDAPFGHRAAVREAGQVRYVGWAVPEAVYVDFDVIQAAPPLLNRSGVGDILCLHTALYDWRFAHDQGKSEAAWPYDPYIVAQAQEVLDAVWTRLDDIHAVNETGIRTLMAALRWSGAAYHNFGWNPRPIEGVEHFFFYTLEAQTGRKFIHGQPVCLGIVLGALLQDNQPNTILSAIRRAGVDIRPESMGITWQDVVAAAQGMAAYINAAGLWYTMGSARNVDEALLARLHDAVYKS